MKIQKSKGNSNNICNECSRLILTKLKCKNYTHYYHLNCYKKLLKGKIEENREWTKENRDEIKESKEEIKQSKKDIKSYKIENKK